ncbi:MAG TPA: FMN-binding protein [Candidatus Eisenbacteria bacterium]
MRTRDEVIRITASMTIACAAGAAILGAVYVGTERYQRAAELSAERGAIVELLGLGAGAEVTEVRQSFDPGVPGRPETEAVIYEARPLGEAGAAPRRFAFSLDGMPVPVASGASAAAHRAPEPLGRLFVAREQGRPAGFVVEGIVRGYKNRIRFLVALTPVLDIAGVRVVEHEEDPGLGAEVATRAFEDQFVGRAAEDVARLDVTRDPMPEDWRAALLQLERTPAPEWRERHAALAARERARPIYAVTGATISSRALTDGVRATVDHFRRRWSLIGPELGGAS